MPGTVSAPGVSSFLLYGALLAAEVVPSSTLLSRSSITIPVVISLVSFMISYFP